MMPEASFPGASAPAEYVFLNRKAWAVRWTSRDQSENLAREVLDRNRKSAKSDPVAVGLALRTLAWQARWRGDFEATHALCVRAGKRLEGSSEILAQVDLNGIRAVAHLAGLRRDKAQAEIETGLSRLGEVEHDHGALADLRTTRALILFHNGRLSRSYEECQAAIACSEGAQKFFSQQMFARLLTSDNSPSEAMSHAMPALASARRYDCLVILPYILEVLGTAYVMLDQPKEARMYLDEGLSLACAGGDKRALCQLYEQSAKLSLSEGNRETALAQLHTGLELCREIGYPIWEKRYLRLIGRLLENQGDHEAAFEMYKTLLMIIDAERF